MPYDAFISYKSEDRPWAEAIYSELKRRGRSAFYDYKSLRAGQEWRPQLEKALSVSNALVVIWSKVAAAQDRLSWTDEERYLFDLNEVRSPRERRRPVIFVLLDASPPTLGALHHVADIKDRPGAYPGSPGNVPADVHSSIAQKICDGIDEGLGIVRVKTLVLSAPLSSFTARGLGDQRWARLKALLVNQGVVADGVEPEAELARRYGATPREWRPFATNTVAQLLDALQHRLHQDPPPLRLRFEPVDADFDTQDDAALSAAARKLSRELALIVVDPLALYVEPVGTRVGSLEPCFRSAMNALVVPALKIADDTQLNLLLRGTAAAGLAQAFFRPAIPLVTDLPSVGLHVRNPEELGRILILALGRNAPTPTAAVLNSILAPG